jgi:acyl CoA:acetate/3-ketoacid CoA transferase
LTPRGLQLEEIAPGISVESVLAGMEFKPLVESVRAMPLSCFKP